MKKLSLVMAAAMCATVGGVYASWNYADKTLINYNSTFENISVNITNPTYNGAVLSVNVVRDGLGFVIDGTEKEVEGVMTENVAAIVASGNLKFDFTPAETSDIQAVKLILTVTHIGHGEYDGRSILKPAAQVDTFEKIVSVVPGQTSAVQTYTLADIFAETGFGLNGDFVIGTPNAYDNFKEEVTKITEIKIAIAVEPVLAVALPAQE